MLPSFLRLPLRTDPEFFSRSSVHRGRSLRFYFQKNDLAHHRFAVVVKKAHGKATQRALTRRRILSSVQPLLLPDSLPNNGFWDVVAVVQGSPKEVSAYQQDLATFFAKTSSEPFTRT